MNSGGMRFFRQTWLKILIVVIMVLVIGSTAAYLTGTRQNQPNTFSQPTPSSQALTSTRFSPTIVQPSLTSLPTSSGQTNVIPGWKTYINNTYHYSLSYPSNWILNAVQADPDPKAYDGTRVILTSPEGHVLTLEYYYATGSVPLHIYKFVPVTITNESFIKTYDDGCDFNTNDYSQGMEKPSYYDCASRAYIDRGIFQITYGLRQDITNSTIPEYTSIHGKAASLRFEFKKHIPLGMENTTSFQQIDTILDKIISSIKLSS
jgi:hypothetical protein